MAAALNVASTPPAAAFGIDSSRPVSSTSGVSSTSAKEFAIAVHAINHRAAAAAAAVAAAAAGKLEAPISIRLSESSANSSATSFTYSGSADGRDESNVFWLKGHHDEGRPSFTSETTDLSTLTARSQAGPGGGAGEEFYYDDDVVDEPYGVQEAAAGESAESTLSGEGSEQGWYGWGGGEDGESEAAAALGEMRRNQPMVIETDRTSVSSSDDWADCEYEVIAAQRVNDLFEQIDSLLYSRTEPAAPVSSSSSASSASSSSQLPPPSAKTHEECAEWRSAFPHLRLRGLLASGSYRVSGGDSAGFSHHPAPDDVTPRPPLDRQRDGRDVGLQLFGRSLAVRSPVSDGLTCGTPGIEEVLAQEGCVEEAIALDDLADSASAPADSAAAPADGGRPAPRRSRSVVEPVTPGLALRDSAQCAAFDALWGRMVAWAMPLFIERLRRSRRFQQQQSKQQRQEDEEADEEAGPLISHGGASRHPHRHQPGGRQAATAAAAPSDPRLAGDLAGLLSISTKTLQLRADAPILLVPAAASANASGVVSAAGFVGRRPLGRLAPVPQHHQLPHHLQHQHQSQTAGLYASFTRSGTLPPLHDYRKAAQQQPPVLQLTPAHPPMTMRGSGPATRPGSGGRPGAYSSLDWPAAIAGRPGGPRANSSLHHRGLDVHGRALGGGAPAELDALYETPALRTAANSLHFSPATSSYQQMRRSKPAAVIRR